jgi:hypothetical protein
MPSKELAVIESTAITPMRLIELAADRGASIEQMQQLFELKLRVEADEAKKAFHEAFTAFKNEPIRITKDKENKQYSKDGKKAMYASIENMVATVTPYLSKHGLSHNWEIDQSNGIKVSCVLTHTLGHSKEVSVSGPADDSGAKNKLQQIKSTLTYLKVTTFESVCGLASEYGNLSDDGNGAGLGSLEEEDYVSLLDSIQASRTVDELQKVFRGAYKKAQEAGDKQAMASFIEAKDKLKAELS